MIDALPTVLLVLVLALALCGITLGVLVAASWEYRLARLPPRHPAMRKIWELLDREDRVLHAHEVTVTGDFGSFSVDTRYDYFGLTVNGLPIKSHLSPSVTDLDLRRIHFKAKQICAATASSQRIEERKRIEEQLARISGT